MRARALAVHDCARARGAARYGSCSRTWRQRREVEKCHVADKKQTNQQTNKHTLLFYRYRYIEIEIGIGTDTGREIDR